MRSFLNVIDLGSGRQIRVAEFGFYAERPSFHSDRDIGFFRGGKPFRLSLETGIVSSGADDIPPCPSTEKQRVYLNYKSSPSERTAYVELIYEDASERRVIARFMGGDGTLGARPFNSDYSKVVFFGYPSDID